jgi:hypothetical protein
MGQYHGHAWPPLCAICSHSMEHCYLHANSMIDRFSRTPDFLILRYASLRRMSTVETPPPGDATVHVFLF